MPTAKEKNPFSIFSIKNTHDSPPQKKTKRREKARNQVAAFSCAKITAIELTCQKYAGWGRKMYLLWKNVCSVRKRAYKKAYLKCHFF